MVHEYIIVQMDVMLVKCARQMVLYRKESFRPGSPSSAAILSGGRYYTQAERQGSNAVTVL